MNAFGVEHVSKAFEPLRATKYGSMKAVKRAMVYGDHLGDKEAVGHGSIILAADKSHMRGGRGSIGYLQQMKIRRGVLRGKSINVIVDKSAFGVVHKSFKKLDPKLTNAFMRMKPYEAQNMDERIKLNYVMARQDSGQAGVIARKFRGAPIAVQNAKTVAAGNPPNPWQPKKVPQIMVEAAGKRSKRKGRKLP